MTMQWGLKGIHLYCIADLYNKENDVIEDYLPKRGFPIDSHPGTDYTSEVLYVSFAVTQIKQLIAAGK
jgi:hypothetical protein